MLIHWHADSVSRVTLEKYDRTEDCPECYVFAIEAKGDLEGVGRLAVFFRTPEKVEEFKAQLLNAMNSYDTQKEGA